MANDSRMYILGTALSLFAMTYYLCGVDGCQMLFPDACKGVECPKGQFCTPFSGYWCANRTGSTCLPRGQCGIKADPCKSAKCSSKEQCVLVLDQCKTKGGCTFHSQCNEVERAGSCPREGAIPQMETSCSNKCANDATCQAGAKCCPGGRFGNVCVRV